MANIAVRNATVLTGADATASMGPASVTQDSTAASAILVSSATSVCVDGSIRLVLSLTLCWERCSSHCGWSLGIWCSVPRLVSLLPLSHLVMEASRGRFPGNLQDTDLVLWNKASSSESPSPGSQTLREGAAD